ncbi:MAG: hypothetical protein LQ351_005996 [Letrouitia transgressa]|nr:MAG: hypothetical protein LQ351_005996 [Letrouitia transgressa]
MDADRHTGTPRWVVKTLQFFTSGLRLPRSPTVQDSLSNEHPSREPSERSNSSGCTVTRSPTYSDDDSQALHQARRRLALSQKLATRWKNKGTQTDTRIISQEDRSTQIEKLELPSDGYPNQEYAIPCTTPSSDRLSHLDSRTHDLLNKSHIEMAEPNTPENSVSHTSSPSHEIHPETASRNSTSMDYNDKRKTQDEFESKGLDIHPPYTDGPIRVIMANDGYKNCLALLLTAELVDKVNQIAARNLRLKHIETNLKRVAGEELLHRALVKYKEEQYNESEDDKVLQKIQIEMGQHQELMAEASEQKKNLEARCETLRFNLAYSRAQSQEMLEQALGQLDLLSDPEAELREEDSYRHGDGVTSQVREENASSGHDRSQTSTIDFDLDEVYRNTVKECYMNRKQAVFEIGNAFDSREKNLAEEKAEYQRRVREGTCFYTQTEFDILALQDFQELTKTYREAEHAFEEAYNEARALKVLDPRDAHYQESGFSYWNGGYPSSGEQYMKKSAPTSRINHWLSQLSMSEELSTKGEENIELQQQAEEGCDIASATMSESWSCVDLSQNRRRIDHWRKITERER